MSPSAHDFLLEAAPVVPAVMESEYQLVLTSLTLGQVVGSTVMPCPDLRRLKGLYLRPMQRREGEGVTPDLLEALGKELAAFLLPPALMVPLGAALLRQPAPSIRLHLLMPQQSEPASLPWEYLFLEGASQLQGAPGFLCQNPHLHLIRSHSRPLTVPPYPTSKVRILIAWADPGSAAYPTLGFAEQEADDLKRLLEEAWDCRGFDVEMLPHATPAGLEKKLDAFQPHILHFIGHGNDREDAGQLILEGASLRTEAAVSAHALKAWLRYKAFRLVVLSACRTAALGFALMESGIPAVVAMQAPWRDKLSGVFMRALYSALVAGKPLEEALCQARQAILGTAGDWGIPALFLAGNDSRLLEILGPPPNTVTYPANMHFVGREEVLKQVRDLLQTPDARRVALTGLGGIGKTQLAVEYAHKYMADYPGGVFWLESADTTALQTGYANLAHLFAVPPGSQNQAEQVRIRLQQQHLPTLLICNNLTSRTEINLLPAVGACRILATTREGYLADSGFHRIEVSPLNQEAATQLLQTYKSAEGSAEVRAAEEIVKRVGRLPLALALVAHHVGKHGNFAEYLKRLKAAPLETLKRARQRFTNLTGHDGNIFNAMNLSYQALDETSVQVLRTAACFAAQEISLDLLEKAAALSEPYLFREALDDLEAYCLITRDGDRGIHLHALLRDFVLDQAGEERNAYVERLAGLLTKRLRSANERMDWKEVRQEQDHCRALVDLCEQYQLQDALCDLMTAMGGYLFEHADLQTAQAYYTRCLELSRVRCGARSEAVAHLMMRLAHTLLHQGAAETASDLGESAFTMAKSLWEEGNPKLADYYNDMGYILRRKNQFTEALQEYKHALILCEHKQSATYASIANNIGTLYESLGDLTLAQVYVQGALEIDEALFGSNHPKTAIRLNNIGRITLAEGHAEEALQLHSRALQINHATYGEGHPDIAASYFYIGQAESKLQRHASAKDHYTEALKIYVQFYGSDHNAACIVRKRLDELP